MLNKFNETYSRLKAALVVENAASEGEYAEDEDFKTKIIELSEPLIGEVGLRGWTADEVYEQLLNELDPEGEAECALEAMHGLPDDQVEDKLRAMMKIWKERDENMEANPEDYE